MNLKQLAAIQFINQIKDENRNYYYKAEDLIEDAEKAEKALKILTDLELIDKAYLNNVTYYKIKDKLIMSSMSSMIPSLYSIEPEISKYKKSSLTTSESLLRQIKLLQSIRSSGEEEKLIGLIDKWENVTREVIKELFNKQSGGTGSLRKFVKGLGLKYEDLGFDEGSSEEGEEEEGEHDENIYFNNNNYYNDEKRIKYQEY